MRRALAAIATMAVVTTGIAANVAQGAPVPLVSATPGYVAENVEYLGSIPLNSDSAGARFHDDKLFVTEDRGLSIYDLSDAEHPELTGFWPSPQWAYVSEEDVDTNGEIVLIGSYEELGGRGPLDAVNIIDVRDPAAPVLLSTIQGADEHTISCVWKCNWAWGSAGTVVDLRDPANPALAGNWWGPVRTQLIAAGHSIEQSSAHDVTEIAPGLVMVSTNPVAYVQVNGDNAAESTLLHVGPLPDRRYIHGNSWVNGGVDSDGDLVEADELLLVGGETSKLGGACGKNDGAFMVFDATAVNAEQAAIDQAQSFGGSVPARTAEFTLLDEWRVEGSGLYTDGNSPYNQFCAHWFTTQPGWSNGGVLAAGWYEHGVRFLDVDPTRENVIEEVGFFVPLGGSTSAAYWVTDEIVYTTDYQRGIDVIRFRPDSTDGVTMAGDAPLVAARLIDPNSYFPWFGRESDLTIIGIERDTVSDDGWTFCKLPVTAGTLTDLGF